MQLRNIPVLGLLFFFNLQMFRAYPVYNELMTNDDTDLLKMLLHRLEESIPERSKVERVPTDLFDDVNVDETTVVEEGQQQAGLDEAAVRDFLSARNLKTTRNDSSKRSSGCFGRRMDRIGSMSSLGCNTVGRYSPKRR